MNTSKRAKAIIRFMEDNGFKSFEEFGQDVRMHAIGGKHLMAYWVFLPDAKGLHEYVYLFDVVGEDTNDLQRKVNAIEKEVSNYFI